MEKHNFCLKKSFVSELVFVLSGALVMLFAFLIMLPQVETNSYAEGETTDEGIVIVFSPEIDVSLKSSDDGYFKIVKDTVEISTSSQNGYTLYLSTDTAEHQDIYLNGDTSSSSKISGTSGTYESPKPLEDYTWGWAVPGMSHFNDSYDTENPSTDAKFAATPLSNQIIRDYIEPATGDTAEVYYGFKLGGELETGNYETNITYTAVPAVQPLVARAILGDNGNLNFVYNRNTYTAGDIYTDNIGETTIADIYEVPMNSVGCTDDTRMPWYDERNSITSANVDISFVNAKPTGTCGWFSKLFVATNITNLQYLNTSSVVDMSCMFSRTGDNAASLDISDLSGWDTSSVTSMSQMFSQAGYHAEVFDIGDLSGWDTKNVTNMFEMFRSVGHDSDTFDLKLSGWDAGSVTDMSRMFDGAGCFVTTFNLKLDGWNTGSVTNMRRMFYSAGHNATTWSIDGLGDLDTGNVTDMSQMFEYAGHQATAWDIDDLSGWDTSSVTNMSEMFYEAGYNVTAFVLNLGKWNTSSVTNMSQIFRSAGYLATTWSIGDLSGWNTSSVTDMSQMFDEAGCYAEVFDIGDLSKWDTSSATNMFIMFGKSAGRNATTWNIGDISGWDVTNVTNHASFIWPNVHQTNISVVNNPPHWNP